MSWLRRPRKSKLAKSRPQTEQPKPSEWPAMWVNIAGHISRYKMGFKMFGHVEAIYMIRITNETKPGKR